MLIASGGHFNLGARGKNLQKLMLSEKKKWSDLGLHIFLPKSRCSLKKKKKKRSSLPFALSFPYFSLKIKVFSKKEKVFTQNLLKSWRSFAARPHNKYKVLDKYHQYRNQLISFEQLYTF